MKLYRPLHVCAYFFGVFPAADKGPPGPRFRVHWPGVALKVFHTLLYWLVSLVVSVVSIRNLDNYQLTKRLFQTRMLDIEELFVYMMFAGIAATTVCQAHLLCPAVVRAINECFFELCRPHDVTGAWQFCTAFAIVLFVAYEFAMYFVIITYKFTFSSAKLICLFPPLSNVTCIVIEQFFYLMCVSLYLRLRLLHRDVEALVHKAQHPRWRYRAARAAGGGGVGGCGGGGAGIPAFSASDIRDLRHVHRACMDLYARINRLFQLPLSFCMFDCLFRVVVYAYGVAFEATLVVWQKKRHVNYADTAMWSGYCVVRVVRLWYLHLCEHYVTRKILPIRLSLSWLSLVLNPITSQRLMPEIILFQHQLDTIKAKFEIFGVLNINMTLFYAGFGTTLAYIALLLQFFAFNQISMANISTAFNNATKN